MAVADVCECRPSCTRICTVQCSHCNSDRAGGPNVQGWVQPATAAGGPATWMRMPLWLSWPQSCTLGSIGYSSESILHMAGCVSCPFQMSVIASRIIHQNLYCMIQPLHSDRAGGPSVQGKVQPATVACEPPTWMRMPFLLEAI